MKPARRTTVIGRIFCGLTLAVTPAVLGCSNAVPIQTGYYTSTPLSVPATIPVRVRSVCVLASTVYGTYRSTDLGTVTLSDERLNTLEDDIKDAFQVDLSRGGPFREPKESESPYLLDVEFSTINMTRGPLSDLVTILNIVLGLGTPIVFGSPVAVINVRSEATFHLYAPNGTTLIQETTTKIKDTYAAGLYYNARRSIGSVAGILLRDFKLDADKRRSEIATNKAAPEAVTFVGRVRTPVVDDVPSEDGTPMEILPRTSAIDGKNSIALVIGIEKYRRDLPAATGAASDARLFAQFAQKAFGLSPSGIHVLVDADATKSSIEAEMEEWMPRNSSVKGNVYLFFAGHGAPDPQSGTRYLVPWDADPKFISTQGINIEKLTTRLAKLNSAHTFAFIDACFSGAGGRSVLAAGTRPLVVSQAPLRVDSNRLTFISASGPNETTGVGPANHGLFSYHIFRGLNGEADKDRNGSVTVGELVEYTGTHVSDDARRENRDQHPSASGATGAASKVVVARLPPRR